MPDFALIEFDESITADCLRALLYWEEWTGTSLLEWRGAKISFWLRFRIRIEMGSISWDRRLQYLVAKFIPHWKKGSLRAMLFMHWVHSFRHRHIRVGKSI